MAHDYPLYIALILIAVPLLVATRNLIFMTVAASSFLLIAMPLWFGITFITVIVWLLILLVLAVTSWLAVTRKMFLVADGHDIIPWRIIARPFAFLFIPINIFFGHRILLFIIGVVALVFITIDLFRLISHREFRYLFKRKEVHSFSSMTAFLVSIFIVFLLFPVNIAYLCLAFLLIGDLFGKIIGIKYGRTALLRGRTLEGTVGFVTGGIYAGFIIYALFPVRFIFVIIGSCVAALAELFSWEINDNFTVGIVTGGVLLALQYFVF
jgi:glycerol-3-phosphate acyltransferase PlsY